MATSTSQSALRLASGRDSYARLDLTHSLYPGRRWAEIVFGLGMTVAEAKDKIYTHTGTPPAHMHLYLRFPGSEETSSSSAESRLPSGSTMTLGEAGCVDGCVLHVVDTRREENCSSRLPGVDLGGGWEGGCGNFSIDGDSVSKYVMDDEVYNNRPDTMRKFLAKLQQERADSHEGKEGGKIDSKNGSGDKSEQASSAPITPEEEEKMWLSKLDSARAKFKLGDRCRIAAGDRRGSVAYVGPRPSMSPREIWIGIALDEPVGSTDGTDRKKAGTAVEKRGATRLFECNGDKYGEFARLHEVEVGDFPPLDPFDLLDEI